MNKEHKGEDHFSDKKTEFVLNFCDLMCKHAHMPEDTAVDGAGSCRTFVALYCDIKKTLVHKNMPCMKKVMREQNSVDQAGAKKK